MTEKILPRRHFLRGGFLKTLQSETVKTQGFQGVRPPWAVEESLFVAGCTRCDDCIRVCETHIIVRGEGGFPEVTFSRGECTFCQKCVDVCKQPIFRPHLGENAEAAWQHKVEIQANCLAFNHVECRACEDNCETRAIQFKREIGGITKPHLNLENCNGCGACLSVCPVSAVKILRNYE
ncbi:periplasmic nitrate reductase maturation protein NapF [Pasteurella langaaensis DSM 22999]|uniref:Ferredoxin-type protein NapF n=1 Tax=Alitibacter langaaensis DSM 22999 TaxID=1122935 RepID=A0A2U0T822_9PAST|nr:ferredoxin-type protein NapF [Pasteurella langaaensis]PVX39755.1 periplasmic nitrate reductase maturation protein NapF [Pasteurella langaaensis DSM 22999]